MYSAQGDDITAGVKVRGLAERNIQIELFQDVQKWHIDKRVFLIGVFKQVGTTRLLSILFFKNHSARVKKKIDFDYNFEMSPVSYIYIIHESYELQGFGPST